MGYPIRNHTRERSDAPSQPNNSADASESVPPAAGSGGNSGAVAQRLAESALELGDAMKARGDAALADFVTVCAWCPELHVLRVERKPDDVIVFAIDGAGKLEMAYRKRPSESVHKLKISDGICDVCRAKLLTSRAIPEGTGR